MQRSRPQGTNAEKGKHPYDILYIIENGVEASRADFEESMPDDDDRVFYEVSLSIEDSFLVTGNLKHYPISPRVITPAMFLDMIRGTVV